MSTSIRPALSNGQWEPALPGMTSDSLPGSQSCTIVRNRTRMSPGKAKPRKGKTSATIRPSVQNDKLLFCLYITRGERASVRALANLRTICREHFNHYEIEVVDARKHPQSAERDGVLTTPALIKRSPAPAWTIVGDLSEDALILTAMKRKRTARRNP